MFALVPLVPLAPTLSGPLAWTSDFNVYRKGKAVGTLHEIARLAADESGSIRMIERLTLDPKTGPIDEEETSTYGPGGVLRHEEIVVRWKAGTTRCVTDLSAKSAHVRYTSPKSEGSYEKDAPPGPPCGVVTPRMMAALAHGGTPIARTVFHWQKGQWDSYRVTLTGHEEGHAIVQRVFRSGSRERIALDANFFVRSIAQSTGYVYVRTAFRREAIPPARSH